MTHFTWCQSCIMLKSSTTLSPPTAIQTQRGWEEVLIERRMSKSGSVETDRQTDRQRDSETGHALQLPHSFKVHQALLYFPTTQPPTMETDEASAGSGRVEFSVCSYLTVLTITDKQGQHESGCLNESVWCTKGTRKSISKKCPTYLVLYL